jgi:hypothetical protein
MTATTRLALLVLGLGLILGSALGSEYAFGSKVLATDSDVGMPLFAIPIPQGPVTIEAWDVGTNPAFYDDQDIVYLHFGPFLGAIEANDIRLTPYGSDPAGSKVTPFDNDIGGLPTLALGDIEWLDLYGVVGSVDLRDPMLVQDVAVAPESDLNDVRITMSEGMPPGTRLSNSDPDFGKNYALPALALGVSAFIATPGRIEYFDRNANNLYDYPDDIYFHTGVPAAPLPLGRVNVGDVRLSGPVY